MQDGAAGKQDRGHADDPFGRDGADALLGFIDSAVGGSHVRVEESLGSGFVRLRSSEAERRQAKHDIRALEDVVIELLRNARDAGATRIYLATAREGSLRSICCLDNGMGVPAHMHERIFEPRVTSKLDTMSMDKWGVHGRGMALFSISQNVVEARVVASAPGLGTSLLVCADVDALPERADQSSHPQLGRDDDGRPCVRRGPHNINRTVAEFALETRGAVEVYLGSPAEIASTLWRHAHEPRFEEAIDEDSGQLPVCLAFIDDDNAVDLAQDCQRLGLAVSQRTAHRIVNGQVRVLEPYIETLFPKRENAGASPDIFRDNRSLKVSPDDIDGFSRRLEEAFDPLAQRYYISLSDTPKIKVGRDSITVTFPIEKG